MVLLSCIPTNNVPMFLLTPLFCKLVNNSYCLLSAVGHDELFFYLFFSEGHQKWICRFMTNSYVITRFYVECIIETGCLQSGNISNWLFPGGWKPYFGYLFEFDKHVFSILKNVSSEVKLNHLVDWLIANSPSRFFDSARQVKLAHNVLQCTFSIQNCCQPVHATVGSPLPL